MDDGVKGWWAIVGLLWGLPETLGTPTDPPRPGDRSQVNPGRLEGCFIGVRGRLKM